MPRDLADLEKKKGAGAPFFCNERGDFDQPLDARRARRPALGSSMLLPDVADAPLDPDVALAPVLPAPVVAELEAPPFDIPEPDEPDVLGVGLAAPISPAAVPGPARPALSVSAGEPVAAYALAANERLPATNANMSFFISNLPKKDLGPRPNMTSS